MDSASLVSSVNAAARSVHADSESPNQKNTVSAYSYEQIALTSTDGAYTENATLSVTQTVTTESSRQITTGAILVPENRLAFGGVSDGRALGDHSFCLLRLQGHHSVGDTVRQVLSWKINLEREALRKIPQESRNLEHPSEHLNRLVEHTASDVRAWWKENRDSFGFGNPTPPWRSAYDEVLLLDLRKPVPLVIDGKVVKVVLDRYDEVWSADGRPVTTVDLRFWRAESNMGRIDGPGNYDGYVHRHQVTSGDTWEWTAAFMSTPDDDRVRVRLMLHYVHEQGR